MHCTWKIKPSIKIQKHYQHIHVFLIIPLFLILGRRGEWGQNGAFLTCNIKTQLMWRSQGGRLSASHRRFLCLQKSKGKLLIINNSLCCHKPFLNLYATPVHEHCNKHFLICNLMFKICIFTTDTPLWNIIKYMKFFFPLIKNDHLLILQKRFGLVDRFWCFRFYGIRWSTSTGIRWSIPPVNLFSLSIILQTNTPHPWLEEIVFHQLCGIRCGRRKSIRYDITNVVPRQSQ